MAEVAGLALSAVGIGTLFTTCVQCFDIVINAKAFRINFELLRAQLDFERLRFFLWGQSVGLALADNVVERQEWDRGLYQPHVQPVVEKHLLCIKHLLEKAEKLSARYASAKDSGNAIVQASTRPRPLEHMFFKFKRHVRRNQRPIIPWKIIRWTLHDQQSFESVVQSLRNFIDGLEKVTKYLDVPTRPLNSHGTSISSPYTLHGLSASFLGSSVSSPYALLGFPASTPSSSPVARVTADSFYSLPAVLSCVVKGCLSTYHGNPKWCETALRRHEKLVHKRLMHKGS